jgi:hypothetical protein
LLAGEASRFAPVQSAGVESEWAGADELAILRRVAQCACGCFFYPGAKVSEGHRHCFKRK